MTSPIATCACGIYLCVPHEHAPGVPKTGAPFLALATFGPDRASALANVELLMIKGLVAKVGEGLYKVTDHGSRLAVDDPAWGT